MFHADLAPLLALPELGQLLLNVGHGDSERRQEGWPGPTGRPKGPGPPGPPGAEKDAHQGSPSHPAAGSV